MKTLFFNIINIIHHTISHLNLIIYTTIYNVQELSRLLFSLFPKGFYSIQSPISDTWLRKSNLYAKKLIE